MNGNWKTTYFMGNELNEDGSVKGCTPVIESTISEVKKITENEEKYVIEQCVKLHIDPEILKKQSLEINRLKLVLEMRESEISDLKKQNEQMKAAIQEVLKIVNTELK